MFQFPGLPLPALFYSGGSTRALPRAGFPIRKSSDQRMVSSFPRLIAAAHVLHRLLAPRHPPCALVLLIRKNTFYCCYGVFKVHADGDRPREDPPEALLLERRSLKTQQRSALLECGVGERAERHAAEAAVQQSRRARRIPGEPEHRTAQEPSTSSDAYRSKSSDIP